MQVKESGEPFTGISYLLALSYLLLKGPDSPSAEFKELLENEKNNFRLVNTATSFLGGVPAMINPADMSNTIPNEKVRAFFSNRANTDQRTLNFLDATSLFFFFFFSKSRHYWAVVSSFTINIHSHWKHMS